MKNIGLKTRLLFAVGLLTLLMAAIAYVGYRGIVEAEEDLITTYDDQVLPLLRLKAISDSYQVSVIGNCRKVLDSELSWADGRREIVAAKSHADAAWQEYNATHHSEAEKILVAETNESLRLLEKAMSRLRDILQSEDRDALRSFTVGELRAAIDPLCGNLDKLSDIQRAEVADKIKGNQTGEDSLKVELLIGGGIAVAIAIGLGLSLGRMARDLNVLVRGAQSAGVQVSTSVTEIAATAKEQQATANEIAATTSEIGATSKEISATSKELVKTMSDVSKGAEQTAALAGSGHAGLARMEELMRHVMEAAGAINAKLAVLNEKAGNINQVVTTITKVADQTNLLSLNAAIEAEKAGEFGRGFSVVATEIRRLADQTAVATYDIEQIVKEMLSAVSASVMGMDKFGEEVRRGVDEVRNVSAQLSQIIEHVQSLTPRFETVNEGMQAQATGAQQISEALGQLSEAAQQTVESLRQSTAAIEQLNETARGLRAGVERIKT